MNTTSLTKPLWTFWVIAAICLIWHVMGSMNFIAQMNAELVSQMPDDYRSIIEGRPLWATVFFAIAVFGGVLGSIFLLMRTSIAVMLFIASFVGVIVQMIPFIGMAGVSQQIWVSSIISAVVALFYIWYAKRCKIRNWIR